MKTLALALLLIGLAQPALAHDCEEISATSELSQNSIYNLRTHWTDQNGHTLALDSLRGHPVVIAMFYTSCGATCPVIAENMKRIQNELASRDARFVLVSFDPKRDTPERLRAFAEAHHLAGPEWVLLQGDSSSVRKLSAVLGVRYRKNPSGDFSHSNTISYVDGDGVIRYRKNELSEPDAAIIGAMKQNDGSGKTGAALPRKAPTS